MTMKDLVEMLHLKYGRSDSVSNLSGKLSRGSLRYDEAMEIADVLGTSQTMYARYERGANELPIRHLITLCKYYGVSADFVLGINDEK